jgi:hypothetical protein
MSELRESVVEMIEVALVELKGIAQPPDMAQLSELLLDAKETDDEELLGRIAAQVKSLRSFCEGRHDSDAGRMRPKKR